MSKPSIHSGLFLSAVVALTTAAATPAATTVVVDPATRYQTFKGWGTSLCWFANMAGAWPDAKIDTLCGWITSPDELNMNVFRYNVGGGDAPSHHHMRVDGGAIPGFKASATAAYDWSQDANQRKILQRLASMRPDIVSQAFSNSPPWWMTKSGCASGNTDGSDNLLDADYTAFADYLTEVVRHYHDSLKITFSSIAPFNEPLSSWWKALGAQEGCAFSQASQNRFIPLLYTQLQTKNMLGYTKIAGGDDNSIDQTLGAANGYTSAGVAGKVGQIETHTYSGSKRAQLYSWALANKSELWNAESGKDGANTIANTMLMAQRTVSDLRDLKPVVWCEWQVMTADIYQQYGGSDLGEVQVHYATQAMTRLLNYYMRKQFMHFISPGYTLISSSDPNSVAAVDPSSSQVVVILCNSGAAAVPYSIDLTRFKIVGTPTLFRTSATENYVKLATPVVNAGLVQYSAPVNSVSTFVFPLKATTSLAVDAPKVESFRAVASRGQVVVSLDQPLADATYRLFRIDGSVLADGPLSGKTTSLGLPVNSGRLLLLEVVDRGRRLGIQSVLVP
jgi:hypothetical protein